jgi:hypothetical protein
MSAVVYVMALASAFESFGSLAFSISAFANHYSKFGGCGQNREKSLPAFLFDDLDSAHNYR